MLYKIVYKTYYDSTHFIIFTEYGFSRYMWKREETVRNSYDMKLISFTRLKFTAKNLCKCIKKSIYFGEE
jgi:hypothetical protein